MREKEKESQNEGRDDFFMDVDRMINEGLGGGTVSLNQGGLIEDSRELEKEDPPAEH